MDRGSHRAPAVTAAVAIATVAAAVAHADETSYSRYVDTESDRIPAHTVVPAYPRVARRDRVEGEVQVCYHIDRKGRPYRIAVRSSTHRVFERPAIRAIRASTYRPLEKGQTSSGIKSCRTFRFALTPTVAETTSPDNNA